MIPIVIRSIRTNEILRSLRLTFSDYSRQQSEHPLVACQSALYKEHGLTLEPSSSKLAKM